MSNELCKCGKVGEISCPHDDRCGNPMSNTDNTLPEELQKAIQVASRSASGQRYGEGGAVNFEYIEFEDGYIAGATEYAPYKVKYERLLKMYEEDIKRNMRLNMPGISDIEQERTWQSFKQMHDL